MRPILLGLALFSVSSFIFAACEHEPGTAMTSSTSGTGGAPTCDGVIIVKGEDAANVCDVCLRENCCPELSECRDQGCIDCANLLLQSCGPKPRAVVDCLYRYCQPICSPGWIPTSTTTGG
jgi:hypothetical protein